MIRRSEKSCKEGVCSIQYFPHTTRCCACSAIMHILPGYMGTYIRGGGGGVGGIYTKTAHRGQIQVNVIPCRDFSKSKFLTQGGLKEEV